MVNYRFAVNTDAIPIARLHAKNWQLFYKNNLSENYLKKDVFQERESAWSKRFTEDDPNQQIIIAEENNELIGFACTYLNDDPYWGAYLDNLHILPGHQGKRIGMELMQRTAKLIQEFDPSSKLYLWVITDNYSAINFYEKIGGEEAGVKEQTMPDGSLVDTYRYVWMDLRKLLDVNR